MHRKLHFLTSKLYSNTLKGTREGQNSPSYLDDPLNHPRISHGLTFCHLVWLIFCDLSGTQRPLPRAAPPNSCASWTGRASTPEGDAMDDPIARAAKTKTNAAVSPKINIMSTRSYI